MNVLCASVVRFERDEVREMDGLLKDRIDAFARECVDAVSLIKQHVSRADAAAGSRGSVHSRFRERDFVVETFKTSLELLTGRGF